MLLSNNLFHLISFSIAKSSPVDLAGLFAAFSATISKIIVAINPEKENQYKINVAIAIPSLFIPFASNA